MVGDVRNENLETQTFADRSFDLVITIDVLSYANDPEKSVKRIARTLDVGGAYLFTVPTYKGKLSSERRAAYKPDGTIEYMKPAEHHHSHPNAGGLVTFHYGYDLPQLVSKWTGLCVEVTRFEDAHHGIVGEFTDVYSAARLQSS